MIITRSGLTVLGMVYMASRAAQEHDWGMVQHCKNDVEIALWHIENRSWRWM